MIEINVSLASNVVSKAGTIIREALLQTRVFKPWAHHPEAFRVVACHEDSDPAVLDIRIAKIEDVPLPTPHAIDVEATEQCNKHQSTYHVISGRVTSGSPEGGTIRFQYRST
jgi:hypothetical protein